MRIQFVGGSSRLYRDLDPEDLIVQDYLVEDRRTWHS